MMRRRRLIQSVAAGPYWLLILLFIAVLTAFPQLALWLPGQMFN